MDDLYRIATLKYLYFLLDLKKYEKELEANNIESMIEDNDHFKYFSLLSEGNIDAFSDDEKKEFLSYSNFTVDDALSNGELMRKLINFVERTYKKYYFANSKGEYVYYGTMVYDNKVPDDAFALGINYIHDVFEEDEEDDKVEEIITKVINDIQFTEAEPNNIKVAVVEKNGFKFDNDLVL